MHVATPPPPPHPDWHTSPRPGLLQPEMARGTDKRGEGRKPHAVLLKEPLEMISCGFKPPFHMVVCCLGVRILGNHRAVEIVSQGDWKRNITIRCVAGPPRILGSWDRNSYCMAHSSGPPACPLCWIHLTQQSLILLPALIIFLF